MVICYGNEKQGKFYSAKMIKWRSEWVNEWGSEGVRERENEGDSEGEREGVRERENKGGRKSALLRISITCIYAEYQHDTESHYQHNFIF